MTAPRYAELHAHSHYSLLDAVGSPADLVDAALELGLSGLAVTDHDGLYAAPGFAVAARGTGLATVYGAELNLQLPGERTGMPDPPGQHLLVLAADAEGYRRLSGLISEAHLRGGRKNHPVYPDLDRIADALGGHAHILTGCRKSAVPAALSAGGPDAAASALRGLVERFGTGHVHVELSTSVAPGDDARNDALADLAEAAGLPVLAAGNVHYPRPGEFPTFAAVAALRAKVPLDRLDSWLPAGPTAYLRSPAETAALFDRYRGALANAADLAQQCAIDFDTQLRADPPRFDVPDGFAGEDEFLAHLVQQGLRERYGTPEQRPDAYTQAEHELSVIASLGYAGWFLAAWDVVRFAREQDPPILCQGRGSSANSLIVHVLGISAPDPIRYGLLFERFLNVQRDGAPDIDLDVQASRREIVLQYLYRKHGRRACAMVANEVTLRPRFALREAARALGYSPGVADAMTGQIDGHGPLPQSGGAIPEPVLSLARGLADLPRHFSIHSGGVVIANGPISDVLPVEWARMKNRTVIQGDKEAAADAGLIKQDILSLGALDAVAESFLHLRELYGIEMTLADVPADDPKVFDMINAGMTIGCFQIESRAQQSVSPLVRARTFDDLAVQIALIRPGPGASGASRRYLARRRGKEKIPSIHPDIDAILARTLGVVLFQESAMEVAIAAGFSAPEADRLRRAMGAKRSARQMAALQGRFLAGLTGIGVSPEDAEDLYQQIASFSGYGFPASHSLSFAYIALATAWLKRYYPAIYVTGLLNAQPMGFYAPATLITDAIRQQVTVRPACVQRSQAEATLEPLTEQLIADYTPTHPFASPYPQHPVRLGLSSVRSVGEDGAKHIAEERDAHGPYADIEDLARRTELPRAALEALAVAGALDVFGLPRRETLWVAGAAAGSRRGHLPATAPGTEPPPLGALTIEEATFGELWAGWHSAVHPMELVRERLAGLGVTTAADLHTLRDGAPVRVCGIITHRQRPPTKTGVTFLSAEDATGQINVIVPGKTWDALPRRTRTAGALIIYGTIEAEDGSISVLAGRLEPFTVSAAPDRSRSFQ